MNATAADSDLAWFAVLTKARSEALALQHLERQGFSCLLPKVRHQRRTLKGMQSSIEPLFPRYVFLRARSDGWTLGPVRSTRGVSGVVRFGGRAATVPSHIVEQIQNRMDDGQCVQLDAPQWLRGEAVKVTEGPFAGMRAIFDADSGTERVRLLMEVLGERVAVLVPRTQLVTGFAQAWG